MAPIFPATKSLTIFFRRLFREGARHAEDLGASAQGGSRDPDVFPALGRLGGPIFLPKSGLSQLTRNWGGGWKSF